MTNSPEIAFIGLGRMGVPMVKRLVEAGHRVAVWNRTPERAEPLAGSHVTVADTPADAARGANVVVIMLADPPAVERVLTGEGGLATGSLAGKVVIDCSTVGPEAAQRFGAIVSRAGGRLVDAPVLGSTPVAEKGALTVLAGGDVDAVRDAEPVLAHFGRVVRTGPLGTGNALKLVMNLLVGGLTELLAEAVVLAERSGLPRELVRETLFSSVLKSPFLEYKAPQVFDRQLAPLFSASLMLKDLDLVLAQARRVGAATPASAVVRDAYAEAVHGGAGEKDFAAVIEAIDSRSR